MSPCTKDLGKIHGIRDAEWFNLKLEIIERDGDKGEKFSGQKNCFSFLISYPSVDREKQLPVSGVIRLLGSLRKKPRHTKNLGWVNEVIYKTV